MKHLLDFWKSILIVLNLIIAAEGITIIVLGANAINFGYTYNGYDIALGSVLVLTTLFGFFITTKKNAILLVSYAYCALALAIIQFIFGICVVCTVGGDESLYVSKVGDILEPAYQDYVANRDAIDGIQISIGCCGNKHFNEFAPNYPPSCCGFIDYSKCTGEQIYAVPCSVAIVHKTVSLVRSIGGVCISCSFVTLFAGLLALTIGRKMRQSA